MKINLKKKVNLINIFKKCIYGNTSLFISCKKAFKIFEKTNYDNKKVLIIISDGLLSDDIDIEEAENRINTKIQNLEITTVVFI